MLWGFAMRNDDADILVINWESDRDVVMELAPLSVTRARTARVDPVTMAEVARALDAVHREVAS